MLRGTAQLNAQAGIPRCRPAGEETDSPTLIQMFRAGDVNREARMTFVLSAQRCLAAGRSISFSSQVKSGDVTILAITHRAPSLSARHYTSVVDANENGPSHEIQL